MRRSCSHRRQYSAPCGCARPRLRRPAIRSCLVPAQLDLVSADSIEHLRINLSEELGMQPAHSLGNIRFVYYESQVDLRCPLGNHAHIDVANSVEDLRRDPCGFADIFSDQADDGFAARILHEGELLQVRCNLRDSLVRVDRERDADLRGRDDIYSTTMAGEDVEHLGEKAMRHKHARGDDLDNSDAILGCDGLEQRTRAWRPRQNTRALVRWVARIQHQHGNVLPDRWKHRRGMQYLGAEVSELGGLFEANDLDATSIGADPWVGGLHAVHVGPDLDAVSIKSGANQRGGEVGTAATYCRLDAFTRCADEAAHDRYTTLLDQRLHAVLQAVVDFVNLRDGAAMLRVGNDDLPRIDQCCGNIAHEKCRSGNHARQSLAERDNVIGGARRQLSNGSNAAQEFIQRVELRAKLCV